MKKHEVEVVLTLTEGYAQRFTEACLEQLKKRERQAELLATPLRQKETA